MACLVLSEQQRAVREYTATHAREVLGNAFDSYNKLGDQLTRCRATQPFYEKLISAGLLGKLIPKSCGGSSESYFDMGLVLEELYAVNSSISSQLIGTSLGLLPIVLGDSQDQKERWLKPFLTSKGTAVASLAHSEPDGTANFLEKGGKGLGTTARKEGDYYIVNGEKVSLLQTQIIRWLTRSRCSSGQPIAAVGTTRVRIFAVFAFGIRRTVVLRSRT